MILALKGVAPEAGEQVVAMIKEEANRCLATGEPFVMNLPPGIELMKVRGAVQDAYIYQPHGQEMQIRIEVAELLGQQPGGVCRPMPGYPQR